MSINPSDAVACYHLGRLSLLLGEKGTAKECLMAALAQKPTLSPARYCLGLALPASSTGHAKPLLAHGLKQYLSIVQESHETQAESQRAIPKELNSKVFYRRSNTLLVCTLIQPALRSSFSIQTITALLYTHNVICIIGRWVP